MVFNLITVTQQESLIRRTDRNRNALCEKKQIYFIGLTNKNIYEQTNKDKNDK